MGMEMEMDLNESALTNQSFDCLKSWDSVSPTNISVPSFDGPQFLILNNTTTKTQIFLWCIKAEPALSVNSS